DGIVQKQLCTGYHNPNVWFSILFQIVAGLYALQINGIYIHGMTLQDNIYIKDLRIKGNMGGYWKYIIDGITYYIPNYGFLVMIDTNYKDIPYQSADACSFDERVYKIVTAGAFGKPYSMKSIREMVHLNYK